MLALAGVDSLVLIGQKRYRGKTRPSSVVVRVFCFLLVRAHHFICSLEIGFLPFLVGTSRSAVLPVFRRSFAYMLLWVRDNGERFVERQRAKETINGGFQMDFIDEPL